MSGASIIIHKQNKLIGLFNEAGAVDAEHAIFIDRFGIKRSFIFNRMAARGIFIKCEPEKFYIDNNAVPVFKEQRRSRALIALVFVLIIAALLYVWQDIKCLLLHIIEIFLFRNLLFISFSGISIWLNF